MELGGVLELFLKYALVPLATVGWYVFKKQDSRIESLEKRTSETEKALIEIKTEFRYINKNIDELKSMVSKLQK